MDKSLEQSVASLEALLRELVSEHEQLLELMRRQQQAMRRADAKTVEELCMLENEKVQTISELEKQRLDQVGRITLMLDAEATEPLAMSELIERLPAPACDSLGALRQELRSRMLQVREQTSVVRRASEALMKHMQGLVQNVTAVSTGAPTYGQRGGWSNTRSGLTTFNATA